MRPDMFELIIERPRLRYPKKCGSAYPRGTLENQFAKDWDNAPAKLGMSAGHRHKHLNENLAPLIRFLRAQVARPWNKVRSEICAQISASSAVQKHVLDHIDDFVEENVIMVDRLPHALRGWPSRLDPLYANGHRHFLYVCPSTGLLRLAPNRPKRPAKHETIALDARAELRRIEGVWWHIRFAPLPTDAALRARCFDIVLEARLTIDWFDHTARLEKFYGRIDRFAVAKREPGKRELRRTRSSR